jgi:hypothetical protein
MYAVHMFHSSFTRFALQYLSSIVSLLYSSPFIPSFSQDYRPLPNLLSYLQMKHLLCEKECPWVTECSETVLPCHQRCVKEKIIEL